MSKLVYTSNIPFDMSDWSSRDDIIDVAAGCNCVTAVLKDGTVLKKICASKDNTNSSMNKRPLGNWERICLSTNRLPDYRAQLSLSSENGWDTIKQICVSKFMGRTVVGLRANGTCVAYIDPEKNVNPGSALFSNKRISGWRNIVEIAVSDAIFGLDSSGKVHHFSFYKPDDYYLVDEWENVSHIVTGAQNSVFGITNDGRVLCAGSNCDERLCTALSQEKDVKDICATGSECEVVFLLNNDNTISTIKSIRRLESVTESHFIKLFGHFYYTVFAQTDKGTVIPLVSDFDSKDYERISRWNNIYSFSLGQRGYSRPFAIAVLL